MVKAFVNNVDSYTGKILSKVFNSAASGAGNEPEVPQEPIIPKQQYEVIGTLQSSEGEKPEWVSEVIQPAASREALLAAMLTCDVIVYNISDSPETVSEASWAVEALHGQLTSFASLKVFICVSTVLTWARSKPVDPEDLTVPFTEEDYRRRRPHPNFKDHVEVEKLVTKLGKTDKTRFWTYVIASGLKYGVGEDIFHFLFKSAWHGEEAGLPIYGDGANVLPTIHIQDLASIIVNVANAQPKTRYILAVDGSHSTQGEIVKAISDGLGTGMVHVEPKESALLNKELSQCQYDQLMLNIQLEALCVKDSLQFVWVSEAGLVEQLPQIIKEYKETRNLLPIRVCVLGPPGVGKTTIIEQLCKHYKLHHLKIADVIKQNVERLEKLAARTSKQDENEEDDARAQQAKEHLDLLKEDTAENNGRYSDQHIVEFYKETLKSKPCQNQGFILDGFPKTCEQAKELFAEEEEEGDKDEGEKDAKEPTYNKLLMPETIVSLDASDDFLKTRIMNLPESKVAGTHNTEEGLLRRLALFREQNEDDVTVLNYFDELEIHPSHVDVEKDSSQNMADTIEHIKELIGEPRNYGPTPEEIMEMERKAKEERLRQEAREREERDQHEAEERSLRAKREAEWTDQLTRIKREEQEMLETQSIPLRNYLMKNVMPTLTQGLIEVCKVKPDDPVDYLAEYMFKHNPQVD